MLAPLFTNERDVTILIRNLVTSGAELYIQGDLEGSMEAYNRAIELLGESHSIFDRLWIDINRVDTQIRAGQFDAARETLNHIIPLAQEQQFKWLEAKAQSIYGSSIRLIPTYTEMLKVLAEADRTFTRIGASSDRVRPLYYLAGYHNAAGDHDEALRLALECLRLAAESDAVRMSSLNFLIGTILYRQGMSVKALLFAEESVEQTHKTKNAALETGAASSLGQLHQSMSSSLLAEKYLKMAQEAFNRVPEGLKVLSRPEQACLSTCSKPESTWITSATETRNLF
jgi:tetratricopeptide (TPR) repeat protein